MGYRLALAEKPSVAQAIAKVLGASKRCDGYLEGNGWLVSWCVGHLVELAEPESYDEKYRKWRYEDLPGPLPDGPRTLPHHDDEVDRQPHRKRGVIQEA